MMPAGVHEANPGSLNEIASNAAVVTPSTSLVGVIASNTSGVSACAGRGLDEDAVAAGVVPQRSDQVDDIGGSGRGRKKVASRVDSGLPTPARLHSHVGVRGARAVHYSAHGGGQPESGRRAEPLGVTDVIAVGFGCAPSSIEQRPAGASGIDLLA